MVGIAMGGMDVMGGMETAFIMDIMDTIMVGMDIMETVITIMDILDMDGMEDIGQQ
jgi:hypothetical protein